MNENHKSIMESDSERLSELFDTDTDSERIWTGSDLAALCQHQLSSPVEFDMSRMRSGHFERIRRLADAQGLLLNSYRDLFEHSQPPLELLVMVKDFAKYSLNSPESILPKELLRFLYYASIAVARLRHGRGVSKLSDSDLRKGLEWAIKRDWMDDKMRNLFQECLNDLESQEEGHE